MNVHPTLIQRYGGVPSHPCRDVQELMPWIGVTTFWGGKNIYSKDFLCSPHILCNVGWDFYSRSVCENGISYPSFMQCELDVTGEL